MTDAGPQIDGLSFVEHLGTGGYSDVFMYERDSPRMKVAVKVLKARGLTDAKRDQFAAEAETMAELADHPYIVQVFSTGTSAGGRPYLVMKYYPPPNLGVRASRERFAVADVLRTGIHIASAVETAHRAGIVHRDIKPANILVSPYGEPALTDFGIAGRAADTAEVEDLGVSIPWSPPEVLDGTSNGSVRADVYSLGATLWTLLVGRSPFEIGGGDNSPRQLVGRVLRVPAPPTGRADVPVSLERLLQQALAKDPSVRPSSALEFARALQLVEQEQRWARTEIRVGGLGPVARPAERDTRARGDETRQRAPMRVSSGPTPPARPLAAPLAPARPGPPSAIGTARRPPVPDPAPARAASGDRRPAAAEAKVTATLARPAAPSAPAAAPAADAHSPRGRAIGYVVVAIAVVVIVVAVIAVVLSAGGSGAHHPRPSGSPPPSAQNVGGVAAAPTVTTSYDASTHTLRFQWSLAVGQSAARYLVTKSSAPDSPVSTTAGSLAVVTTAPASVCVTVVAVAADGSRSQASPSTCGPSA